MVRNDTDGRHLVRLGILVALCTALFLVALGDRALWDIDEGWHAVTSKRMVQTGDWIRPEFNGEPFHDKPPLYNWLVALSFVLLGFTEFAARLPSALLGFATVLVTYVLGRRLVGDRAAFLGAVILACSVEMIALSRSVVHDIGLTFLVCLALLAFFRAYAGERGRTAWLFLAYAAVGSSVLAKGPLGGVLFGAVVVVYLALRRDLRFLLKMKLVRGVLLAVAISAPWYGAMAALDPDYIRYFLLEQNLGNFMSGTPRHPDPFHFYVPVLLMGMFPWSFHLPLVIRDLVRWPRNLDPAILFLLTWSTFVFLFFSVASSKLASYLLPMFPAVALLLGVVWDRVFEGADRTLRRWLVGSHLVQAALVGWALWALWVDARGHRMYDPDLHGGHVVALTIILVATLAVSSFAVAVRRYRLYFGTTAALLLALIAYLAVNLAPAMDPYRSTKEVGLRVDTMLRPGEKLVFYPDIRDSAMFYTDREALVLVSPQELEEFLRTDDRPCVVDTKRIHEVEKLEVPFRVLGRSANKLIIVSAAD